MTRFLSQFTEQFSNASETTYRLITELGVKATKTAVLSAVESHPDFPTLLSISEVLKRFGVDSIAFHSIDGNTHVNWNRARYVVFWLFQIEKQAEISLHVTKH